MPSYMHYHQLAKQAQIYAMKLQHYPSQSQEWAQANINRNIFLSQFFRQLYQEINKYKNSYFLGYITEDAFQETCLYITENIHRYNPQKMSAIAWFKFILKKRKIDVYNFISEKKRVVSLEIRETDLGFSLLDIYHPPQYKLLPSEEIIQFLKEDPEGLFAKTLFKKNPQANFQAIALQRLQGFSWQEIVTQLKLGNSIGPVSTFYHRCCRDFHSHFQDYLCS